MVVLIHQNLQIPSISSRRRSTVRSSPIMSSSSDRRKLMDFPHLSATHRNLMVEILSEIEMRIGSQLLPSSIPQDLEYFENQAGSSQGAMSIRSGDKDSKIDIILGSWLHCKLPSVVLDITTVASLLNTTTDAPHLLLEFIQSSPTSLILVLDLLPRKDLVLHPDYLHNFYEDTSLEKLRQKLEKRPEIQPFLSASLYIRSLISPTAISININCGGGDKSSGLEEFLGDHVGDIVKEVVRIWLDQCVCSERAVAEVERENLRKRDAFIKKNMIELDLTANLPKLFDPDVASRVAGAVQKVLMP
eukprot:TRINITY_DN1125_c0_g1_i2.p1 TRINITY_DN1125_c0_g1~~TRINITY_DN1125_c0_g1_i2.p1  ORF type:complete len:303 (-),score=39.29 TRINITY_DN1125_c0_g1_i2:277-1185(-)